MGLTKVPTSMEIGRKVHGRPKHRGKNTPRGSELPADLNNPFPPVVPRPLRGPEEQTTNVVGVQATAMWDPVVASTSTTS